MAFVSLVGGLCHLHNTVCVELANISITLKRIACNGVFYLQLVFEAQLKSVHFPQGDLQSHTMKTAGIRCSTGMTSRYVVLSGLQANSLKSDPIEGEGHPHRPDWLCRIDKKESS